MAQVEWGGAISIKKRSVQKPQPRHTPWVELCKPKTSRQIKGNRDKIKFIREWFTSIQCGAQEKRGLFVHGPSGVWKSLSILLVARETGFDVVHTQSDVQRTPQKLDAVMREVNMSPRGILVLDEFESFMRETTSLKWLTKFLKSSSDIPVVIVCNAVDKTFHQIRDLCTVVEFESYTNEETYSTLLRLSQKVSGFCHLPTMDCYFVSSMSSGNLCQTINQLQLLYYGTEPMGPPKKKRKKLGKVQSKCMKDSGVKMWSTSHRATSVECFLKDDDILDTVAGMNKDFMAGLSDNVIKDYILYFHNGKESSLDAMYRCADELSLADVGTVGEEEDRLYDGQNSDRWSEDNVTAVGCLCRTIRKLGDRDRNAIVLKKSVRKTFNYK